MEGVAVGGYTSMSMAGVIPLPDQKLHLLPLLSPKKKYKPPLDRLSTCKGNTPLSRASFNIKHESGTSTEWTSTMHVFPAAFPRSHYAATAPPSAPIPQPDIKRATLNRDEEKEARKESFQQWEEMTSLYSVESMYPPNTKEEADKLAQQYADTNQVQLWSCVQRIIPDEAVKDGITVVMAHANGFHKEIFEPTVESLVKHLTSRGVASPQISEIWSLDTYYSGDAGTLNDGHLGQMVPWVDNARDILQFVDFYLPSEGAKLDSVVLPAHSQGSTKNDRKVIGVGHSFSGAGMLILNGTVPGCFDGAVIIDPISFPLDWLGDLPMPKDNYLAQGAIARKDVFSNRKAVEEYFAKKPYFTAWDPRVVKLHSRFGLRPLNGRADESDPPLTLSTSKWSEALSFSSYLQGSFGYLEIKRSEFKGWAHLFVTRQSCSTIYGYNGPDALLEEFANKFSTTRKFKSEVIECNHLVAQEEPDMLGSRIADIIIANESKSNHSKL